MAMKLVKKTDSYSVYLRSDERYAVKDGSGKPVNGDEKVRILVEEGLIKASTPAEPEPAPEAEEAEAPAEEGAEEASEDASEEGGDDE